MTIMTLHFSSLVYFKCIEKETQNKKKATITKVWIHWKLTTTHDYWPHNGKQQMNGMALAISPEWKFELKIHSLMKVY